MTEYEHRLLVLVEWDKRDVANNWASDWDDNGDDTFGVVRLSEDGEEPPTHTLCNTKATDDMQGVVLEASDNVPFIDVYEIPDEAEDSSVVFDEHGLEPIIPEKS